MVSDILKTMNLSPGKHEIVISIKLKYPLKIVTTVEDDIITVVTNYPLRKGRNESIL